MKKVRKVIVTYLSTLRLWMVYIRYIDNTEDAEVSENEPSDQELYNTYGTDIIISRTK